MSGQDNLFDWESNYLSQRRSTNPVIDALESERVEQSLRQRSAPARYVPPPPVPYYEQEAQDEGVEDEEVEDEGAEDGEVEDEGADNQQFVEDEDNGYQHAAPATNFYTPTTKPEKIRITFLTGDPRKVADLLSRAGVKKVASFQNDKVRHRTTIETMTHADADNIVELLVAIGRPDYAFIETA
jgi:hypothetical protein